MLRKCVTCIINNNVTVLEAQGKRALADDNYYCKMTSVIVFTKVTSFYHLKYVTNTLTYATKSNYWEHYMGLSFDLCYN